jgi:hypothetical protein
MAHLAAIDAAADAVDFEPSQITAMSYARVIAASIASETVLQRSL